MVTIYNTKINKYKNNTSYLLVELRGLSTDEKPTEVLNGLVENGSVFIEIDTGKVYMFDKSSDTWNEV